MTRWPPPGAAALALGFGRHMGGDPGRQRDVTKNLENTGSNPERDAIELAELKCAISLRADPGGTRRGETGPRISPCDARGNVNGPWRDVTARIVTDPSVIARASAAMR